MYDGCGGEHETEYGEEHVVVIVQLPALPLGARASFSFQHTLSLLVTKASTLTLTSLSSVFDLVTTPPAQAWVQVLRESASGLWCLT
jgi:hypothetical protein